MEEVTINIRDLILKVVLKWRLIIVSMLIFGVLFNCIGYAKKSIAARTETNQQETVDTETDADEKEILHTLNAYRLYQMNYKSIHDYLARSIRMQIDPSQVPTYTIQYMIDNHYKAEYPVIEKKDTTEDIINSYITKLKGETVLNDMLKELKCDGTISDMQELMDIVCTEPDILTITIVALSREDCNTIASVICSWMDQFTNELIGEYGTYDISLINREYSEKFSIELLNERQNRINTMDTICNSTRNLIKNLSDSQKKNFFEQLEKTEEDGFIDLFEEDETSEKIIEELERVHVSLLQKKYLLLGMILGMMAAVLWVVCRYIFSGKIHVKGDITETDIPVLGTLYLSEPSGLFSFVDSFILRIADSSRNKFSKDERKDMILSGINLTAQKEQLKSVFVTGTSNASDCIQLQEELCSNISVESVERGRSIICDPKALSALALADGVILVEKLEDTLRKELHEELELCRRYGVKILGCIILD